MERFEGGVAAVHQPTTASARLVHPASQPTWAPRPPTLRHASLSKVETRACAPVAAAGADLLRGSRGSPKSWGPPVHLQPWSLVASKNDYFVAIDKALVSHLRAAKSVSSVARFRARPWSPSSPPAAAPAAPKKLLRQLRGTTRPLLAPFAFFFYLLTAGKVGASTIAYSVCCTASYFAACP